MQVSSSAVNEVLATPATLSAHALLRYSKPSSSPAFMPGQIWNCRPKMRQRMRGPVEIYPDRSHSHCCALSGPSISQRLLLSQCVRLTVL